MSKYCQNCGAQMEDNAVFCANCGTQSEVAYSNDAAPAYNTAPAYDAAPAYAPAPASTSFQLSNLLDKKNLPILLIIPYVFSEKTSGAGYPPESRSHIRPCPPGRERNHPGRIPASPGGTHRREGTVRR